MDESTSNVPQAAPKKKGKGLLIAIIVIIIIALGWYFFAPTTSNATVAIVDGQKITQNELDSRVLQLKTTLENQGTDVSDPAVMAQLRQQTLDQLINEVLVIKDAEMRDISVSRSDVNDQFDIVAARFTTTDEFKAELDSNKFTEKQYKDDIRRQLLIQRYLDALAEENDVTVTDEEVDATYADVVAQSTEEVPPLADVRDDIIAALEQQKVSQLLQNELLRLRDASQIEIVGATPEPADDATAGDETNEETPVVEDDTTETEEAAADDAETAEGEDDTEADTTEEEEE